MEQLEPWIEELELRAENLEYLESLYRKMERRSALHSDILEIIESASIEEIFDHLSAITSASILLKNEVLSRQEITDIKALLSIMLNKLRKEGYEYSKVEMLLTRWVKFHEEIL